MPCLTPYQVDVILIEDANQKERGNDDWILKAIRCSPEVCPAYTMCPTLHKPCVGVLAEWLASVDYETGEPKCHSTQPTKV